MVLLPQTHCLTVQLSQCFYIPLTKLNGCKLCELQAKDNSLKSLRKLAKDSKEGCLYKDGVLMSIATDHEGKRKVIVVPKPLRAKILTIVLSFRLFLYFPTHVLL